MTRYAEQTTVSAEKSRNEIEATLRKYGADQFLYGWKEDGAVVQFRANGRFVRFVLDMPSQDDEEFAYTPAKRYERSDEDKTKAWEQATRQRWRALALVIKAKLEAVETGITEFESEFLAHIVLPSGETVAEWIVPQVAAAYDLGTMPKMLPMPTKRTKGKP